MKFTKCRKGIWIGMFVLALSGCGISETGSPQNHVEHGIGDASDQGEGDAGDHGNDNAADPGNDNVTDPGNDAAGNQATANRTDPAGAGDNREGESLIRSSDLQGSVTEFSDSGCIVSPVTKEGENTAVVASPGNESEETNVNISYKSGCIFQIAIIDLTTGKAEICEASVSDIKKQTSLLIYGDFEDPHNLAAAKIIIVRYEQGGRL